MSSKSQVIANADTIRGNRFREGVDTFTQSNAKAALQHFRQALRQARRAGDETNTGWALLHMAMVLRGQRRYADGIQLLEHARSIFLDQKDQYGLASVFNELALANRESGRNTLALEYAHESASLFQRANKTLELGWVYDNLASIHYNLGNRHEFLSFAKKARAIFLEFDSELGVAWNSSSFGGFYLELGFPEKAERYYEQARETFKKLKSRQGYAWSLFGLATVKRFLYQYETALDMLKKAADLFHQIGFKDREAWCFLNESAILRTMGKSDEAHSLNRRSMSFFTPLRNHDGVAWSLFQMGQHYRDRGQYVKAWQTFRESLNLHTDISNRKGIGWSGNEWGRTYLELTDQNHARDCFIKAKVVADKLDEGPLKAEVEKNLAHLNIDEGLFERADEFIMSSLEKAPKFYAYEVELEAYLEKARLEWIRGNGMEAASNVQKAAQLMSKYDLAIHRPEVEIYRAEAAIFIGKWDEGIPILRSALDLGVRMGRRRVSADALLGLFQAAIAGKTADSIKSLCSLMEKYVRLLSSQKIKAKYLILKNVYLAKTKERPDMRLIGQALQIASNASLAVCEKHMLELLTFLFQGLERPQDAQECRDRLIQLCDQGPVDLKTAVSRMDRVPDFPLSLTI